MLRLFIILAIMPAFLFGSTSWTGKTDDDFSVDVTLSKASLPVDERLDVTLRLHYPDTHTVDLDKIRINLLKYAGLSEPPFALVSEIIEDLPDGGKQVFLQLEPLLEGINFLSLYDVVFPPKNPEKVGRLNLIGSGLAVAPLEMFKKAVIRMAEKLGL